MNMVVLLPAGIGLGLGVLVTAYTIMKLLKKYYTMTFAIMFGFFLSVVPSVLNERCVLGFNFASLVSLVLVVVGFFASYSVGRFKKD